MSAIHSSPFLLTYGNWSPSQLTVANSVVRSGQVTSWLTFTPKGNLGFKWTPRACSGTLRVNMWTLRESPPTHRKYVSTDKSSSPDSNWGYSCWEAEVLTTVSAFFLSQSFEFLLLVSTWIIFNAKNIKNIRHMFYCDCMFCCHWQQCLGIHVERCDFIMETLWPKFNFPHCSMGSDSICLRT